MTKSRYLDLRYRQNKMEVKQGWLHPTNDSSELRIVLIGKTGSGKSSCGNTILGTNTFHVSLSPKGVTKQCQSMFSSTFGRQILVVDTPGLNDLKSESSQTTSHEITKCISMASPGPHVILLVIGAGRFTQDDINIVKTFEHTFGDKVREFVAVVFTRQDDLEINKCSFDEFMEDAPLFLKELLQRYRHTSVNATLTSDAEARKIFQIIDEIAIKNEGTYYSEDFLDISRVEEMPFLTDDSIFDKRLSNITKHIFEIVRKLKKKYFTTSARNSRLAHEKQLAIGSPESLFSAIACTGETRSILTEKRLNEVNEKQSRKLDGRPCNQTRNKKRKL